MFNSKLGVDYISNYPKTVLNRVVIDESNPCDKRLDSGYVREITVRAGFNINHYRIWLSVPDLLPASLADLITALSSIQIPVYP